MLKLWYEYIHDGLERWAWIDYMASQCFLKKHFLLSHPEAYFEYD